VPDGFQVGRALQALPTSSLPVGNSLLYKPRLSVVRGYAEAMRYDLTRMGSGRVLLSTHPDRGDEALRNKAALRSHEGVVIALD
jgi:hypothetical protein